MEKVNNATGYGGRNNATEYGGAIMPPSTVAAIMPPGTVAQSRHRVGPPVVALTRQPRYLLPMQLAHRALGGEGAPVVILHGLFGSAQNWTGMGRRLAAQGTVFALDLRNHGDSPHAATTTLADCVEDLRAWCTAHAREPVRLIGHSLGGLVSMGFALAHPAMVAGVAAVDIAPRAYPVDHEIEFRALRVDIGDCASRAAIEARISAVVPDVRTRQFLATNAVRDGSGFRWRLNVDALEHQTVAADLAGVQGLFEGEALLVACGKSSYVREEDHDIMRKRFPRALIETIADADHWPHVTAPDQLARVLSEFLSRTAAAMQ
jgi:esterase